MWFRSMSLVTGRLAFRTCGVTSRSTSLFLAGEDIFGVI